MPESYVAHGHRWVRVIQRFTDFLDRPPSLRIDPDLFGRWSLFREWGRLDTDGGALRVDSFESEEEAIGRLATLTDQKRKRGYRVLSHQGSSHSMIDVDDEQFQREVQQFAERYLFSPLNEASTNKEEATIAVFALMECMQSMISSTLPKKEEAIAEFEALTQAYVNDWKQHGQ